MGISRPPNTYTMKKIFIIYEIFDKYLNKKGAEWLLFYF